MEMGKERRGRGGDLKITVSERVCLASAN